MLINDSYTASSKTSQTAFIICLSILVITYLITTYACIQDKELYIFILKEDGPLENIATSSVFVASLLFLSAFIRYRDTPTKFYYLLFSFALLFLFFEEISWGQRIFNIATPEVFENLNAQKEINLHNWAPIYKHVNKVAYASLQFYLVGLVLLTLVFERLYRLIIRLRIPMASPATAFLMCANYFLYHDIFLNLGSRFGYHGTVKVNNVEIYEAGIELSLLLFSIECFHRGAHWLKKDY